MTTKRKERIIRQILEWQFVNESESESTKVRKEEKKATRKQAEIRDDKVWDWSDRFSEQKIFQILFDFYLLPKNPFFSCFDDINKRDYTRTV